MTAGASLLLREPPLVVLPSLAKAIGLNAALLLQQIHFRSLETSDGWVQRTRRAWVREITFWSEDVVKRTLRELHAKRLIEAEYVETPTGREPRYRVLYENVEALQGIGADSPDPSGQVRPTHRGKVARGRSFKGEREDVEVDVADATSTSKLAALLADPEVVELSRRLAERMRANDAKAKVSPASLAWLDPIRLLLRRDGRSAAEIAAVIDWCQADDFERTVVLSPRKLRGRFGELWLKHQRHRGDAGAGALSRRPDGLSGGGVDERIRRLREQAAAERNVIDGTEACS